MYLARSAGANRSAGVANAVEVIAAAQLANADQFIHRLPHGYATKLSERAGNLSQGQRQLLAIARAILADPRILILDEATAHVDTVTELLIQQALERLFENRRNVPASFDLVRSDRLGSGRVQIVFGGACSRSRESFLSS